MMRTRAEQSRMSLEIAVMATTLRYVISSLRASQRAAILEEFRNSGRILSLFQRGLQELGAMASGL